MAGFYGDIHRTACRAQRKISYKGRSYELAVMQKIDRRTISYDRLYDGRHKKLGKGTGVL